MFAATHSTSGYDPRRMAEPFLGELRIFSFNFPPKGWALCNGQLLPINQNQALFALLGTMYGGNGQTTFSLPNLQNRVPMHVGNGHVQGESGGVANQTLTQQQLPQHTHQLQGSSSPATLRPPAGNVLGAANDLYAAPRSLTTTVAGGVDSVGGGQAHNNTQPSLVLSVCMALQGLFPTT